MIQDSAPHRVFKISELARLIACQLVLTSRKSTANLARACRYLKEPALSTLWATQPSLRTLLEVLPAKNWGYDYPNPDEKEFVILGDPSPEAWNKVHRYAPWMREVRLNWSSPIGDDAILKLHLSSPAGGWFPVPQELHWFITKSNIHYADLCLSPHLKRVSMDGSLSWGSDSSRVPCDLLPTLTSTISALPTSALQSISADIYHHRDVPCAYFEDAFSSVVLRCGPSFTELTSPIPLSDPAVNHLIQLPHLRALRIESPPPKYSALSLPLVFTPLTEFTLGKGVVCEWFSLFKRLQGSVFSTQGVTPLSKLKESLESLKVEDLPTPIIDSSFTSPIRMFHNLVSLDLGARCGNESSEGKCAFKLNNVNFTHPAMALPRLEPFFLGYYPCFENICLTTVACLLPISVYCLKLKALKIHFSTADIVGDFKAISEDPQFRELRSLPRCALACLGVGEAPIALDEFGVEAVANGMADIFPSLEYCGGWNEQENAWGEVNRRINERAGNVGGVQSWEDYVLSRRDLNL